MDAPGPLTVEPLAQERGALVREALKARLRNVNSRLPRQLMHQELPGADIVAVVARRKLGDPEIAVLIRNVRLRAGASKRRSRREQQGEPLLVKIVRLAESCRARKDVHGGAAIRLSALRKSPSALSLNRNAPMRVLSKISRR